MSSLPGDNRSCLAVCRVVLHGDRLSDDVRKGVCERRGLRTSYSQVIMRATKGQISPVSGFIPPRSGHHAKGGILPPLASSSPSDTTPHISHLRARGWGGLHVKISGKREANAHGKGRARAHHRKYIDMRAGGGAHLRAAIRLHFLCGRRISGPGGSSQGETLRRRPPSGASLRLFVSEAAGAHVRRKMSPPNMSSVTR